MMPLAGPAGPRCYTRPEVLALLRLSLRTFYRLQQRRRLPFLEELRPRVGRSPRYRADLVDRYLRGEWSGSVASIVQRKEASR